MKNKTIIKNKKSFSPREKANIALTIIFSLLSLGLGFVIAFLGKGDSFIETDLITAIITLLIGENSLKVRVLPSRPL